MNFVSIPVIVVICYLIGEVYKYFVKDDNKRNFIPVLLAICGGFLGVIFYIISPEIIPGNESISLAILSGIFSGVSATGANQVVKKLFVITEAKKDDSNNTEQKDDDKLE